MHYSRSLAGIVLDFRSRCAINVQKKYVCMYMCWAFEPRGCLHPLQPGPCAWFLPLLLVCANRTYVCVCVCIYMRVCRCVKCVLLCFIQPTLGNRYGPGSSSRASQGPRTHDWNTSSHPQLTYLLALSPLSEPGVAGKTGVTADRDKTEFRLFNSSSIFNITLREELFSLPKKNQAYCLVLVSWC